MPPYVILSGKIASRFCSRSFCEGVSRRRRSEQKPRSDGDEGIWQRVWVAYHGKCNIPFEKPPKFQAISRVGKNASRFRLFAYAQPAEVQLRSALAPPYAQNDRLIVYLLYSLEACEAPQNRKTPRARRGVECLFPFSHRFFFLLLAAFCLLFTKAIF